MPDPHDGPLPSRRHRIASCLAVLLALAGSLAACEKSDRGVAPVSSASSSAPAAAPIRLAIEPFGSAVFVVARSPDPLDIKGIAKTFSGEILLDPQDLTKTRGEVAVDLTTLEVRGFGDEALDAEVTSHARDFLEVGKESLKEPFRFARVTIRSIYRVSERNLMALPADLRVVSLKAMGELELHGKKHEVDLDLVASFTVQDGVVSRVTLKSGAPLAVSLGAHDIKPRNGKGEAVVGAALGAMGAAYSNDAVVTFEFSAKLARPAGS